MATKQTPLSALELAEIKEAILASVRTGAHGHMTPEDLAASIKAAFSLLSDPDLSEES